MRSAIPNASPARRFWLRMRRLTFVFLLFWFVGNLLVPWYARDLSRLTLFGFPGAFWVVAQGALLVYLGIVVAFSAIVDRLERSYLREVSADQRSGHRPGPEVGA